MGKKQNWENLKPKGEPANEGEYYMTSLKNCKRPKNGTAWEQWEHETPISFELFNIYIRDARFSVKETHRIWTEEKGNELALGSIYHYSGAGKWKERGKEYKKHLQDLYDNALEEEMRKLGQKAFKIITEGTDEVLRTMPEIDLSKIDNVDKKVFSAKTLTDAIEKWINMAYRSSSKDDVKAQADITSEGLTIKFKTKSPEEDNED